VKRIPNWQERQPGDIFLTAVPSDVGWAIKYAELQIHPDAPKDFIPSHAGLVGFPDAAGGTVVEAWLDIVHLQDSVACINPAAKYAGYEEYLEVWRPAAFEPDGLKAYIADYGPEKYGALNLVGFEWVALVKWLTGKNVENPIEVSDVCSQGALIQLGRYQAPLIMPQEQWSELAASDDLLIRDVDPLALRLLLLAHQS